MQAYIRQISELVQAIEALSPLKVEDSQRLEKKFRLEFSYNSNHIEANTLTYGETELLLIFGKTTGNHELREYEEMKAHDVAYDLIKELADDRERPLTEAAIANLHKMLLVRPFWKEAITPDGQPTRRLISVGSYKEHPNSVRLANGEEFHYTSVQETPALMGELISWYNEEERKEELHPVVLAAVLHYRFVRIHPFDDGNGRLSRLLMNYVLLRHKLPPVVIKSAGKKDYLFALNQADTGNPEAFDQYIAEQLLWSLNLVLKAAKGLSLDESDDWQKKLHLLKSKYGISDGVTVKRGKEGYELALKNIVIPFVEEWDSKLKKVEPLFNSKRCKVYINDGGAVHGGNDPVESVLKCFDSSGLYAQKIHEGLIVSLKVSFGFSDLRLTEVKAGFNGGEATIRFNENAIDIETASGQRVSKLYTDKLSDNEIETLTDSLTTWVMNVIEEFMDNQKKEL